MLIKTLSYLIYSSFLLLVSLTSSTSIAAENKEHAVANDVLISSGNLETYHLIQEIFNDKISSSNGKARELELKIIEQAEKTKKLELKALEQEAIINDLKRAANTPPEIQGSVTATIVLAAVAVIITVLGVLIAILSIFGYTNIKQESIKSSQETALSTVNSIAKEGLLQATETSLLTLMEKGRFDEIIQSSISSIAYRGISVKSDFLEEEEQQ